MDKDASWIIVLELVPAWALYRYWGVGGQGAQWGWGHGQTSGPVMLEVYEDPHPPTQT